MNKILIAIVVLLLVAIAGVFSFYYFIAPQKGASTPAETEQTDTKTGTTTVTEVTPTSSAPVAKPVAVMPKPAAPLVIDTKCALSSGTSSKPQTITAIGNGYIKKGDKDICYKGTVVIGADAGSFRALTIREDLPLGVATDQASLVPAYAYDTYGFYIGVEKKLSADTGMYKPFYAEGAPSTPHFLKISDTFYGFYEGDNGLPTNLRVISGVDAASFKAIGYGYGSDKDHIYYRTSKTPLDVDPDTFSVKELNLAGLGDGESTPHPFEMLGIDSGTKKVFHEGQYLEGIDPGSVKLEAGMMTLIYDADTLWYNDDDCTADFKKGPFKKGDIAKKASYASCS